MLLDYDFCYKNTVIAGITFNDTDIQSLYVTNINLMPVGSVFIYKNVIKCTLQTFKKWWHNRIVPDARKGLRNLLNEYRVNTVNDLVLNNLGLSLTDSYWFRPVGTSLTWEQVNFYDNVVLWNTDIYLNKYNKNIDPKGLSPDSALNGNMPKRWHYKGNGYHLIKHAEGRDVQKVVNECFATEVCKEQCLHIGKDFIPYNIEISSDIPIWADVSCPNFCSKGMDLVSARDLLNSTKSIQNQTEYVALKKVLLDIGFTETYIDKYFDYMLMFDFLISNTDRHMNNICVLRDNNLKFICFSPLFDFGDSMLWNRSEITDKSILCLTSSSFYKHEVDNLKLVKNRNALDLSKVPDPNWVADYYKHYYGVAPLNVIEGYTLKLRYLQHFQNGIDIWKIPKSKNSETNTY